MAKKHNYIFLLFIGVSLVHIIGLIYNLEVVSATTKPFILIFLLLYYLNTTINRSGIYIGAVLFSLLGDVLLISNAELNFILGLASFLIAHILYIIMVSKKLGRSSSKNKILAIAPFVILGFGLLNFLKDSLGEMLIPVTVYAIVISMFGAVALLNYLNDRTNKTMRLLLGALFFIVSDSVLAINKFYESNAVFPVIVMVTYIAAQYFICSFMMYEKPDRKCT